MNLMGWSQNQWAAANSRYVFIEKVEIPPTLDSAKNLQDWWKGRYMYEPLERSIQAQNHDPLREISTLGWTWASKLFMSPYLLALGAYQ